MSELNNQMLEHFYRHSLMDKFPGVVLTKNTDGLTIENMRQILTKSYEDLPKDVKPVAERLMYNAELAKKIDWKLDWYYTTEDAKAYLADEELFKGSFATVLKELHSVEYLFDYCDKYNLIIKEIHMNKDTVHLECKRKYRDESCYCPKHTILNKEILPVRANNPVLFQRVVKSLIMKNTPHPGI